MSLAMFMEVGVGGAIGAMNRYGAAQFVGGGPFGIVEPMATLVVNLAGNSLMGAIAGGIAAGISLPEAWRVLIAVRFLSALTTYSSFALHTGQLAARQGMVMTALYVGLSAGLSLAAFFATQALVTAFLCRMPG